MREVSIEESLLLLSASTAMRAVGSVTLKQLLLSLSTATTVFAPAASSRRDGGRTRTATTTALAFGLPTEVDDIGTSYFQSSVIYRQEC